jgi:hypothetical protein
VEQWSVGAFFFRDTPDVAFQSMTPKEPENNIEAKRKVRSIGADAGIWSWYDNLEWLLALPSDETEAS